MQQAIQTFEKQLKSKLEYKASSKISPDTYLYKSFKFFDLYNNGYLTKSDFFKAIAKCGVVVDTHNVEAVYDYYSNKQDGMVHYKEFIENLLFNEEQQGSAKQYSEMGLSKVQNQQQDRDNTGSPMERSQLYGMDSRRMHQQQAQQPIKQSRIQKMYQECDTYSQVVSFITRNLRQKGITSLLQFAVELKSTDVQKSHKINRQKLKLKLAFLSDKAIDLILAEFSSGSQQINYAELIYSLKGQLQPQQQSIIEKAFNLLDSGNEREIMIAKIVQLFRYDRYREEFIKGIKLYENFQGIDDGVFTDEDFMDFFGFLAFAFTDNQQFVNFVEKAYFIDDDARSQHSQRSNRSRQFKPQSSRHRIQDLQTKQQVADFRKNKEQPSRVEQKNQKGSFNKKEQPLNSRHSQQGSQIDKKSSTTSVYIKEVEMIVLRIKKRLASRGTRGFLVFQKTLKNVDTDEDGLITLDQFKQVVRDLKIDITNNQTHLVFDVFDPESTNLISYDQMVQTFKGAVPQKRQQLFQRVWGTIKLSEEHTTFAQIKHLLNFRGHPDIQTGRKYDDEIWKQIQQAILLIQELNGTPRSQNISKKQFYEYFENLSLTTSEDLLFESILQNFWKMQSKVNINQMYAGSRKLFDPASKSYLMDHHRYAVKGGTISSNAPFGTSNQPTSYFTEHSKL